MTRYDDYDLSNAEAYFRKRSDLENRAKLINESQADLYLSIHLNSTTSSKWSGIQIFYDNINDENAIIADKLKKSMGLKRDVSELKNQYMYSRINIPGVLVELGFLSNSEDRKKLLDTNEREIMVEKIVNGVVNYYQ